MVGMGTGRVVSWTAVDAGCFKGVWGGNEMPVWGGGSGLGVWVWCGEGNLLGVLFMSFLGCVCSWLSYG